MPEKIGAINGERNMFITYVVFYDWLFDPFFFENKMEILTCVTYLTQEYIDHPKETKNYTGRSRSSIQFT